MKTALKLEELAQFTFITLLFYKYNYSWWVFPALILLPDLSMIGYLISPKIGAISYNIFHHKAFAILIYAIGYYFKMEVLEASGLILYAHSSLDRIFGYGLKYTDSFKHTHLGFIGN
jgi:Domain of unknown function (DUF4260)